MYARGVARNKIAPGPQGLRQGPRPCAELVPSAVGSGCPRTREISRTTFGWDRDSGRRASFRGRFSLELEQRDLLNNVLRVLKRQGSTVLSKEIVVVSYIPYIL